MVGEKVFEIWVNFGEGAGHGIELVDPRPGTKEIVKVEVIVLGCTGAAAAAVTAAAALARLPPAITTSHSYVRVWLGVTATVSARRAASRGVGSDRHPVR